MRKINFLLVVILLSSVVASAQRNLGIATSDWSGMNGLYLNPANIADTRERIVIDVIGVNAGFDNNLGKIPSLGSLFTAAKDGSTDNLFKYSDRNSFSLLAPYAEVHGPGVMVNINHRHSVALTTSVRGFNQFNNFDQSLFRTLSDPTYTYTGSTTGDIDLTSRNFNYTAQAWTQVNFSYGALVVEEREHKLKAGVTVRYLGGIGYVGLKGNNLDAHYRAGYDSLFVVHSDLQFGSNLLSTRNAVTEGFSNSNIFNQIFGKESGRGVGADLGLVYEYTPGPERTIHASGDSRYKLKVSASVTDLGSIMYRKANNFNANVSGSGNITSRGLSGVGTFDEFRAYAKKQGFKADTNSADTRLYMPTALVLGADYNIEKNFYVNATFIGNIANRQNFGNSYYGQITVTPRYDKKMFTVALPITYGVLSKGMKVGVGVRLYGFYLGSDDMLALLARNQYGFNIYAGGFVPLYKHKGGHHWYPADSSDMAPEPDMEHGGALDTTDNCPDLVDADMVFGATQATVTATAHSTDTDGDGIPDNEDGCPEAAGPASNHGCPEKTKSTPKKTVNFSTTTLQIKRSNDISEYRETLDQLAVVLSEYPSYNAYVNGYTDNTGLVKQNASLSKDRAEAVKTYLVGKGIAAGRIVTSGMGAAQPIASNATAEGRAKNRRVVIMLKKNQ